MFNKIVFWICSGKLICFSFGNKPLFDRGTTWAEGLVLRQKRRVQRLLFWVFWVLTSGFQMERFYGLHF